MDKPINTKAFFGPIIVWSLISIAGNWIPFATSGKDFDYPDSLPISGFFTAIGGFAFFCSLILFIFAIIFSPKKDKRFRSGYRDVTQDGFVYNDGSAERNATSLSKTCIKFSVSMFWFALGLAFFIPLFIHIPKYLRFTFLFGTTNTLFDEFRKGMDENKTDEKKLEEYDEELNQNKSDFEIAKEQSDKVKNQTNDNYQENQSEKEEINLVEEFLNRAIESVHDSDYKNAIKHSKAVLAIDPENEEAKNLLRAAESAEKN
tara:strand:- start:966 stop:1745 length:780 start_codon:yes stop_codon:yes gene_type:complete